MSGLKQLKRAVSNPELVGQHLVYEHNFQNSEALEIMVKNEFEEIHEIIFEDPPAEKILLLGHSKPCLIEYKHPEESQCHQLLSLKSNSHQQLLKISLLEDCVGQIRLLVNMGKVYCKKTFKLPLLKNFK